MIGIHWVLLVTLIVLVIQGALFKRMGMRKISYERFFSTNAVVEGDDIELIEKISNNKLLPVPWLRLESMIHANLLFQHAFNLDINRGQMYQNHRSLFSLMPYTQITRRHFITCAKRGCYTLNTVTMTCGDLLSFTARSQRIQLSLELLVYPALIPMDQIPLPSHSWQGDMVVRRWIVDDPFLISGVREYSVGDALRHVNWKATARSGKLQVHNHEHTADYKLMILLNFEIDELMWDAVTEPERIEQGISYAASIAQHALSNGIETGFGCNGYCKDTDKEPVRIASMNGHDHLEFIFEMMARLEIARSVSFDTFLEQEVLNETRNMDMLLITSFVSAKMQVQIDHLTNLGNTVGILPLSPVAKPNKEAQ